jgi:hypothetical protein
MALTSPVPLRSRRATRRSERLTVVMGITAAGLASALTAAELGRVWRRGRAPLPKDTDDVLGAAEEAAVQTVEVVTEGYRASPKPQTALMNLLLSFSLGFGLIRTSAHIIRARGRFGPFRDLHLGRRHIHHFVPGIVMALVAGGVSVVSRDEELDNWLAIPFGIGAALTLDESALLLQLEDVYWNEEGVVSVQITLAAIALLAALGLGLRLLQRGEERVLDGSEG